MPYTEELISNMALAHIGVQGYISSLQNDRSNEARQCRIFYPHARDLILTMQPWPFATQRIQLSTNSLIFDDWSFTYNYPADCALAVNILLPGMRTPPSDKKVPFKIVRNPTNTGKLILCDMENAILEYNAAVTDPAEFDAPFANAVALLESTMIGGPLRCDPGLLKLKQQEYQAWQAEASTKVMREQKEDQQPESDLVSVRY